MVEDAERYADEDRKRRDLADARNRADQVLNQTEQLLEDHGDKLDEGERSGIDEAVSALRSASEDDSSSADEIQAGIDALFQASAVLAQKMYASQEGDQAHTQDAGQAMPDDEDIVEAEIIDEEDES